LNYDCRSALLETKKWHSRQTAKKLFNLGSNKCDRSLHLSFLK